MIFYAFYRLGSRKDSLKDVLNYYKLDYVIIN